ncbi:MAG: hypothetical protein DRJ42_06320 [Deltaproteobacteria bacterium]|nr:MAG: hypothetical protein DRJ42_06320 [Deltaproteobacteria bacterium]
MPDDVDGGSDEPIEQDARESDDDAEETAAPSEPSGSGDSDDSGADDDDDMGRRDFVGATAASVGLVGLSAGGVGVGFLWPRTEREPQAVYTCLVREVPVNGVKEVRSPRGETIYLTRTADTDNPADILAISTTCSHLGCKVYFKPNNEGAQRFHCPCHQGYFDEQGNPTGGPPERPLARYEVEVRGNLLFLKYRRA